MKSSTTSAEHKKSGKSTGVVLLVEDEAALRRANARVLQSAGYQVVEACDGLQATEAFKQYTFDIILTDITMPGMNGMQLLRQIRDHDPDVPVVLVTANPAIDSAVQAVEFGALKYLIKPVSRRELVNTVNQAVQFGRAAKSRREASRMLGGTTTLMVDRKTMQAALDRALNTLWMAYQPIVNWRTHQIVAYEALVRTHERDLPNPGALLRLAETLGRMHQVGRAVRDSVARTLSLYPHGPDLFVNLHPLDLNDASLFSPESPLAAHAHRVVLEITERQALDATEDLFERTAILRELGYRIAVDDLGSGYSSLNYLAHLAPDIVKVDMALIRGINRDPVRRKLLGSLVTLCDELGISMVAEGIETIEERTAVSDLGCDVLQGFLFAKPGEAFPAVAW